MFNLYYNFKKNLLELSDKTFISTENKKYSFREIDNLCEKLANLLCHLGLTPGDRLIAQVDKSEYNLLLYLSCLRSGIIYVPLNSAYTKKELDYFFDDAKPTVIVCDPKREYDICDINGAKGAIIKTLDEFGNGSLTEELNQITHKPHKIYSAEPDETAVIIYTSGTTGKPKGAMITHQGLLCNAQDLIKVWAITENDTILHVLPLFHVHGLFFSLHTALLSGAKIIFLSKFEPDCFFKYLSQSTVFMGVPTHYTRLLNDNRLNRESCQAMRLFISGSAPLLSSTFKDFEIRTGHILLERYGMSETGINSSNPLNGTRKAGTVGIALPSVKLRIVDDNNNEVLSDNIIGEIQVKGGNLFKGYWMKPEKTKEDFTKDGFFKTGDLGAWDIDGYLSIVGRSKDIVITGGLNVYPKEIEVTIDGIDGVIESAVIGVPHHDFGEAVIAIVVNPNKAIEEQVIIGIVKSQHAGYKCPKKVFFIDSLPKNTMGKIQKNVLRDQFLKIFI